MERISRSVYNGDRNDKEVIIMSLLEVSGLRKIYTARFGGNQVEALHNVNFSVERGEYLAIMGESGSGKTTLLNILAALDKPTAGVVKLEGRELSKIKDAELAAFRRDHLGFVFQEFNLLDTFTVEDNIYLPLVLAGRPYRVMHELLTPLAEPLGAAVDCGVSVDGDVRSPQPTQHSSRKMASRAGMIRLNRIEIPPLKWTGVPIASLSYRANFVKQIQKIICKK